MKRLWRWIYNTLIILVITFFSISSKLTAATLRVAILGEVAAIQPYGSNSYADQFARNILFKPFLSHQDDWQMQCLMCAAIPGPTDISSESVDSRTLPIITWRLRSGQKWPDGADIVGEDVKETVRLLQEGIIPVDRHHPVWNIEKVVPSVVNAQEFQVYYRERHLAHLDLSWLYLFPRSMASWIESPEGKAAYFSEEFWQSPWAAKFRQSNYRLELKSANLLIFTAVNGEQMSKDQLDRIELHIFPRDGAALAKVVEKMNFHLIFSQVPGEPVGHLSRFAGAKLRETSAISNVLDLLVFNTRNPVLSIRQTRVALMKRLSAASLSSTKKEFAFEPLRDWLHPQDIRFRLLPLAQPVNIGDSTSGDPDPKSPSDMVQPAKHSSSSLATAGGEPLKSLSLHFAQDPPLRAALAQDLMRALRQEHLEVEPHGEIPDVFFGTTLKRMQFPDLALIAIQLDPWLSLQRILHSAQIPSHGNNYQGQNFAGFSRQFLDGLLLEQGRAADLTEYLALERRILAYLSEELPYVPLGFRRRSALVHQDLQGFALNSLDGAPSLNIGDWTLSTPKAANSTQ